MSKKYEYDATNVSATGIDPDKIKASTVDFSLSQESEPKPTRVEVVNEGAALIVGDRQQDYGSPEENFARIASYWNIHLASVLKENLTPRQVAEMMVLLKMARTIQSPKRDSYVDVVGYAGIAAELAEGEE